MNKNNISTLPVLMLALVFLGSCTQSDTSNQNNTDDVIEEINPKTMLKQAYQLFKEGNDSGSIALANQVLAIGKETRNDTLVGRALTSLCRNAQRDLDTTRLAELSLQLSDLSIKTGDPKWMMYRAHMNAEMWRLIGDMDRAEAFYNQSMEISFKTGSTGMYTIDHFNKSFVSIAKGDFETAKNLISKYYELRLEADSTVEDAYGLIALAYYLEQQQNYQGAHEVATVTRRLFKEQNLFPEPPDEKPLLAVEAKVKAELKEVELNSIAEASISESVNNLLEKYLK